MTKTNLEALLGKLKDHSSSYEEGRDLLCKMAEKVAKKYDLRILMFATRDDVDTHQTLVHAAPVHLAAFIHSLLTGEHGKVIRKALPAKQWQEIVSGSKYSISERLFFIIMGMGAWSFITDFLVPAIAHALRGY